MADVWQMDTSRQSPDETSFWSRVKSQQYVWKSHIWHFKWSFFFAVDFYVLALAMFISSFLNDVAHMFYINVAASICLPIGFAIFWLSTFEGPPFLSTKNGVPIPPEYLNKRVTVV